MVMEIRIDHDYSAGTQNPDFTYTMVGNYTVNLTVTNASGTNTRVKTELYRCNKQAGFQFHRNSDIRYQATACELY